MLLRVAARTYRDAIFVPPRQPSSSAPRDVAGVSVCLSASCFAGALGGMREALRPALPPPLCSYPSFGGRFGGQASTSTLCGAGQAASARHTTP